MPSIVISRYNENIDWIKNIPDCYKIFLYNKGPKNVSPEITNNVYKYIDLENVGKESDTYLLHMICNVENDDSYTVFSQGDPFDHSENFLALLSHEFSGDVWGYASQWKPGYPPQSTLQKYFANNHDVARNEIFSLFNWGPIQSFDEGAFLISRLYFETFGVKNGINIAADFLEKIGHYRVREKALNATFGEFSYGAIFGVRNQAIHSVERDIYIKALTFVRSAGMAGHIMERLWLHFFDHPFICFDPKNNHTA